MAASRQSKVVSISKSPNNDRIAAPPSTSPQPSARDSHAVTAVADIADRSLHAATARFTGGMSPAAMAEAYLDWVTHLAYAPGKRLLLTTSFLFVSSAQNGLMSTIGQQHQMSGQISAAWNVFASIPSVAALLIGGHLSGLLEGRGAEQAARMLFLLGAAIMVTVAVYAAWKPASVFNNVRAEREPGARPIDDLKRLARHWPVYPALLIWLLWNFAPGSATPLQYYLQDILQATDAQWGQWNAIFAASFIPTFMVFGFLAKKLPLKVLLLWGTVIAIPQMIPLLFIHSVTGALIAAVPMGLMGGVASAAYLDLIIRSCPRGLQGTTLMMSGSLFVVASRFGDVLGTRLYDYYGNFAACVAAITVVYALILPMLLVVPSDLTATADGQS